VDNIKMDLGDIVRNVMDCIGVAQNKEKWKALVKAV
jgi:hypothetical protein